MVALRAWLGTHERGDVFFHGRSSLVVPLLEALLELILSTTKLCLTHERGDILFHGRSSRVIFIFEALPELILGTTKLCLTLLLLLLIILLNALRSRTPG